MPTIQLPAGTNVTHPINLPTCGYWQGLVRVSLTSSASATIHEWLIIYPSHPDGKIRYRRTGGTTGNNFTNWTLQPDQRPARWLAIGETMMTVRYTATAPISVCYETTRTVTPFPYNDSALPGTAYPTEAQYPGDILNGKYYWKAPL